VKRLESGAQKLGLQLSPQQLEKFDIYYQELVDWNRKMNLTSITGYEEVQVRHFLDSLTVIQALKARSGVLSFNLIDVGTGAGLPGIPLRMVFPGARLVLLEATSKKAKFLEHLVAKLGLDNTEVVIGRAEALAHDDRYREKFDVVLSRAVAPLPTLVELALPFGAIGSSFIAQKKGDIATELKSASRAVTLLGGHLREVKPVELEEFSDKRYLVIIDKVKLTPRVYPRRPGIPEKRPIVS
jgi:16S rRNA (guanine527-N7)-methyltransferase